MRHASSEEMGYRAADEIGWCSHDISGLRMRANWFGRKIKQTEREKEMMARHACSKQAWNAGLQEKTRVLAQPDGVSKSELGLLWAADEHALGRT